MIESPSLYLDILNRYLLLTLLPSLLGYRPGVVLDFPKGGSSAIVDALVRGVEKHSKSTVHVNCHVKEILVENGVAKGVVLESGEVIKATKAVVSNADPFITKKLLTNARVKGETGSEMDEYMDTLTDTSGNIPNLKSFIHIHAGIDAAGLPEEASADFPTQWAVVRDWDAEEGVESPRNIVLCSMPSLIDPTLAPEGKHVVHAYVPATEPYGKIREQCLDLPLILSSILNSYFRASQYYFQHGGKEWTERVKNTKRRKKKQLTFYGVPLRNMFQMQEKEQFLAQSRSVLPSHMKDS